MEIQVFATINKNFKLLIQSGNYEKVILELMNKSTKLFPNQYEHISFQSNGECDFIDKITRAKYDAKLPITSKQGQWIGSNNTDFEKWISSMMDECAEFSKKIIHERGLHRVEELKLYTIMKILIENDNYDENIIFFFPFPIVHEVSSSIWGQFASDILSNIYDALNQNGIVNKRKIYAIYPSTDNKIGVRLLNTGVREWFSSEILDEYIKYDVYSLNNK